MHCSKCPPVLYFPLRNSVTSSFNLGSSVQFWCTISCIFLILVSILIFIIGSQMRGDTWKRILSSRLMSLNFIKSGMSRNYANTLNSFYIYQSLYLAICLHKLTEKRGWLFSTDLIKLFLFFFYNHSGWLSFYKLRWFCSFSSFCFHFFIYFRFRLV